MCYLNLNVNVLYKRKRCIITFTYMFVFCFSMEWIILLEYKDIQINYFSLYDCMLKLINLFLILE